MTLRFDRGRYYEDADLGDEYLSRARTITEADVMAFAGLTGDYGPMYTDETYGRRTAVGRRAGHGLLGLGVVEGLMIGVPPGEGRGIASLGWQWRFRAPLVPADTVRARWTIAGKRPSRSRPDCGVVEEAVRLENQRGEVIQEGVHAVLLACRNGGVPVDALGSDGFARAAGDAGRPVG